LTHVAAASTSSTGAGKGCSGANRYSTAATTFDVYLQRSGITVRVKSGCTVLSALRDAGVLVPSTCREGTCGSCETVVLEGEVDHRDSVLGVDERARHDSMMVCVSRARTDRLVLDV
jgi:ferredoxin